MTKEEFLHIECDLFKAVAAFHDIDDEKKRKEFIKNYTLNFCKEHNLNPLEPLDWKHCANTEPDSVPLKNS